MKRNVDWTEILFIAAGILGALLLAWMGHLHVRLPRSMTRRLDEADEWLEEPGDKAGSLERAFRAAREHANAGAKLGGDFFRRFDGEDEEAADFFDRYADRCQELADEAAEVLERRYVIGEMGPPETGEAHPPPPG